ncbi:MAG: tRNA (guanosine(37)-N1)-methyltransferase TrmD [Candidatus Paceibacterota bacterium]|nr:MAG: tRNA (guanosine(37)-N1)-methyltransferase TrmD [Candidatus Paceibacterota bacterium]
MRIDIITIFPDLFSGFLSESLLAKAQKPRRVKGSGSRSQASGKPLLTIQTHYLRDWTHDRHQTVDGKPYGGGPGLVMKVEPIYAAVQELLKKKITKVAKPKRKVILFSPRGEQFSQKYAQKWAKVDQLILICGRYEGIDERIADHVADAVVSIGPYVLNGGEVPAMTVIEAVARLLPGFMHDPESQTKEDHAQYTKPEIFEPKKGTRWRVPKVLLSGNHAKVAEWRKRGKKSS